VPSHHSRTVRGLGPADCLAVTTLYLIVPAPAPGHDPRVPFDRPSGGQRREQSLQDLQGTRLVGDSSNLDSISPHPSLPFVRAE
jgi:hypothetical protein